MAHIEWTRDLDTGIQLIDNQHKRIVEYINKLDDAGVTSDKEQISGVLTELVDYTLSHFTFEESLMEEAGYPFVRGHKRVHQLFVKRVGDYIQRFKMGEDITEELLNTLKAWLVNHIKSDDNDYVELVRTNLQGLDSKKEGGWLSRSLKNIFG
ncbi:MAG: bacteriohemerythrin [Gammaproteobacteria bacterium]|nr:bacteriohemerythrin [Gammaproteobacteria bacterium]